VAPTARQSLVVGQVIAAMLSPWLGMLCTVHVDPPFVVATMALDPLTKGAAKQSVLDGQETLCSPAVLAGALTGVQELPPFDVISIQPFSYPPTAMQRVADVHEMALSPPTPADVRSWAVQVDPPSVVAMTLPTRAVVS
jgi:hypothetical protein